MSENVLVPVEQREVIFYDDQLTAVQADDGQVYVSVRHVCQTLGIDDNGQRQRIRRHSVLNDGLMVCKLHTIQGERETYVLRTDLVPLWLSGIRAKAVKEEIRPKLERFQREAAKVLWEAFREGRLTAKSDFDQLLTTDSPAAQAYKMAQAIMHLAQQQLLLESRLDSHDVQLADYGDRLEQIEAKLSKPNRQVTEAQASQISQAVKAVAMALSQKSGRNEYGGVYGELYRKFGITSYKLLPSSRFEEAMAWLSEWHQSLTGYTPF